MLTPLPSLSIQFLFTALCIISRKTQLVFICSKSTMKTPEKFVDLLGHKNDITDKKQTL